MAETLVGGPWVNNGIPLQATIALYLDTEDAWIVGTHDKIYLKMVKLRLTGENTFDWIGSKYQSLFNESCLTSFTESCFEGIDVPEDKYEVLIAQDISKLD